MARRWASSTEIDRYGHAGDHKGVLLHLRNPTDTTRVKREDKVYPVQPYAQGRVDQFVQQQLHIFDDTITNNNLSAQETTRQWDKLKGIIVTGILCQKRDAAKSLKNTYWKKLRRLYKRYDRYKVELMKESATVVPTDTQGGLQDRLLKLEGVISVTKRNWLRSNTANIHGGREKQPKRSSNGSRVSLGTTLYPTLIQKKGTRFA